MEPTLLLASPARGEEKFFYSKPLLEVKNVTMRFGGLTAIDNLSFDTAEGSITAVIGPNGAGKTTLFNCLTGFYKPSSGRILIHTPQGEMEIQGLPNHRICNQARIARTFQNIRLFEKMTVLENLMVPRQANLEEAKEILGFFTLASYANKPAGELPYGAQRLLEIARALMTKPKLLCLDEPAAGLNPHETEQLNELLLRIRRQFGITILLIEHDMRVVMKISDHIVVLDYGRNIAEGKPAAIQSNPIVLKAYLGEDYQGAA